MIRNLVLTTALLTAAPVLAIDAVPQSQDEQLCASRFDESFRQRNALRVKAAIEACRPLALRKNPWGQYYLGRMYLIGLGFEKSPGKGAQWLTLAAKQRLPQAIGMLGRLYAKGEGVEKNPPLAAGLFLQAAKLGDPTAQYDVGVRYYNGDGLTQSYLEAYKWFTQAVRANETAGNKSLVKLATRKRKNAASRLNEAEKDIAKAWLRSQRDR